MTMPRRGLSAAGHRDLFVRDGRQRVVRMILPFVGWTGRLLGGMTPRNAAICSGESWILWRNMYQATPSVQGGVVKEPE